jgi:hypothetical protein
MDERATKRARLNESKVNLWHTLLCEDVRQETRARLDLASRIALRLTCHAEARRPALGKDAALVWGMRMLESAILAGHGALVDWLLDEAREHGCLRVFWNVDALDALVRRANEDATWHWRLRHMYRLGGARRSFLGDCYCAAQNTDSVRVYQWAHGLLAPALSRRHSVRVWQRLGRHGSIRIAFWLWRMYADECGLTVVDHWVPFAEEAAKHGHLDAMNVLLDAVPSLELAKDYTRHWDLVYNAALNGHLSMALWLLERFDLVRAIGNDEPATWNSVLSAVLESPTEDDALVLQTANRLWPCYQAESLAELPRELGLDKNDADEVIEAKYWRFMLCTLGTQRWQWLVDRGLFSGPLRRRRVRSLDDTSYLANPRTEATLHWLRARGWLSSEWLRTMRDALDDEDEDDAAALAVLARVFTSPAEQAVLGVCQ